MFQSDRLLNRRWKIWSKVKILRDEPLPEVLTRDEVARLLRTFRDGRYRAYFTLVYQCGLRMSEALNIRPHDINGQRLALRYNVHVIYYAQAASMDDFGHICR